MRKNQHIAASRSSQPTRPRYRDVAVAVAIVVVLAIAGGLLGSDKLETWFAQLRMPSYAVPLWAFFIVAAIYYVICGVVLYRLLRSDHPARLSALLPFIGLMVAAEAWNFLFFGLESTFYGFLGIIVFVVMLAAVMVLVRRVDRASFLFLLPYTAWVVYDVAWAYGLWRLNG